MCRLSRSCQDYLGVLQAAGELVLGVQGDRTEVSRMDLLQDQLVSVLILFFDKKNLFNGIQWLYNVKKSLLRLCVTCQSVCIKSALVIFLSHLATF